MSLQINKNRPINSLAEARRLRDSLRQQIKTPGYEDQKRQKIKLNMDIFYALHYFSINE